MRRIEINNLCFNEKKRITQKIPKRYIYRKLQQQKQEHNDGKDDLTTDKEGRRKPNIKQQTKLRVGQDTINEFPYTERKTITNDAKLKKKVNKEKKNLCTRKRLHQCMMISSNKISQQQTNK